MKTRIKFLSLVGLGIVLALIAIKYNIQILGIISGNLIGSFGILVILEWKNMGRMG